MSPEISIRASDTGQRYEALLRISEALSACRDPEDLTRILSEQLGEFLDFFQFYIIVYKENSTEVEWAVVGSEKSLISAYADVPVQERPSWRAYATQQFDLKTFRSTYASRTLRTGFDVRTVQHWMGHKSLETTMRYLVPSQEVHARLDQVTVPGLGDREAPSRKAPKRESGRGGRRQSHPDAKPPTKEARLRADESVARG
jgi:hypothetical protein